MAGHSVSGWRVGRPDSSKDEFPEYVCGLLAAFSTWLPWWIAYLLVVPVHRLCSLRNGRCRLRLRLRHSAGCGGLTPGVQVGCRYRSGAVRLSGMGGGAVLRARPGGMGAASGGARLTRSLRWGRRPSGPLGVLRSLLRVHGWGVVRCCVRCRVLLLLSVLRLRAPHSVVCRLPRWGGFDPLRWPSRIALRRLAKFVAGSWLPGAQFLCRCGSGRLLLSVSSG